MCYMNPPEAVSQCKQCQTGGSGFRRLQPGMRGGCSTTVAAQEGKVECDFCCPTNVTEMYYRSNPAAYAKHLPVFLAHSDEDHVIPRDLLDRTWEYLLTQSGAHVLAHRFAGGDQVTPETVGELAGWISRTLSIADGASSGATR